MMNRLSGCLSLPVLAAFVLPPAFPSVDSFAFTQSKYPKLRPVNVPKGYEALPQDIVLYFSEKDERDRLAAKDLTGEGVYTVEAVEQVLVRGYRCKRYFLVRIEGREKSPDVRPRSLRIESEAETIPLKATRIILSNGVTVLVERDEQLKPKDRIEFFNAIDSTSKILSERLCRTARIQRQPLRSRPFPDLELFEPPVAKHA